MIYRFKATVENLKSFLRVYELKASQTLYDLHEHIQNDLGYAPDQMIKFCTLAKQGKQRREYGLFDMGNGSIDTVSMQTLHQGGEDTLLYVFDMRNDRSLRLEFMEEDEMSPRKVYPQTVGEKGMAPDQFSPKQVVDNEEYAFSDTEDTEEGYEEL